MKLRGAFYVAPHQHGGGYDVKSECDDDALMIEHVPTISLARAICKLVNQHIALEEKRGSR